MADHLHESPEYGKPCPYPTDYKERLEAARTNILEALKDYPNLIEVSFSDVFAGGIQIKGTHKDVKGYYYAPFNAKSPTILYDFSNLEEVTQEFIDFWKEVDNEETLQEVLRLHAEFARYGTH